jgi:hypothetical protein
MKEIQFIIKGSGIVWIRIPNPTDVQIAACRTMVPASFDIVFVE